MYVFFEYMGNGMKSYILMCIRTTGILHEMNLIVYNFFWRSVVYGEVMKIFDMSCFVDNIKIIIIKKIIDVVGDDWRKIHSSLLEK